MVSILASINSVSLAATPASVPGKDSAGQSITVGPSAQSEKMTESKAMQEQRRVELRAALRAHKRKSDEAAQAASAASADAAVLMARHLNARQRAEMRQQLADQWRQQRFDYVNTKP